LIVFSIDRIDHGAYGFQVITTTKPMLSHLAKAKARYESWERRRTAQLGTWTVGRRWLAFVLLPTLLICCGGTVVGIPAAWALRKTIEAGKGASTPDAAADGYLMALSYGRGDGLLPMLDHDHQDELLADWRGYRHAMDRTTPKPSRLDYGSLTVGPIKDGRAGVTVDVYATWWGTDGGTSGYSSEKHAWRFQARNDDGWRLVAVDALAWCGGYIRVDACS
jgi:hypothetical protein